MDLSDLAAANRRRILRLVLRTGGRSRVRIARETGLSCSTVTDLCDGLIRAGILCEREVIRNNRRGRPAVELTLDPENCLVAVAGFSEDSAVAYVADPTGEIVDERRAAFSTRVSLQTYVEAVADAVTGVARKRWKQVRAITIVGPGVVDIENGTLLHNTYGWESGQMVEPFRRFRKPLFLQNGSRLRAVAENWYGVAQDARDFLYFHLDRGIGGAIVMDDALVVGPSHGAGEFGHMVADSNGPRCTCGIRGCVESLASMRAIVDALHHGRCREFTEAWSLFQKGDRAAIGVFDKAVDVIARAIITASTAVGPTTVLLGGRMVDFTDGAIVDMVRDRLGGMESLVGDLDVRRCEIPDDKALVLGAVAYALQRLSFE